MTNVTETFWLIVDRNDSTQVLTDLNAMKYFAFESESDAVEFIAGLEHHEKYVPRVVEVGE